MSDSGFGSAGTEPSGGNDAGNPPVFASPSGAPQVPPAPAPTPAPGFQAFPPPPSYPGAVPPAPHGAAPGAMPPPHAAQRFGAPLDTAAMMRPGIIPLRPLTFGELLDGPLKAIRHNPKVMLGVNALVSLAAVVVMFGMGYGYYSSLFDSAFVSTSSSSEVPFTIGDSAMLVIGSLLGSLVLLVSTGVTSLSFSRSVIGERMTAGESLKRALRALPALVVQSLLLGVGISLVMGAVVLIVAAGFTIDIGAGIAAVVIAGLGATALVVWIAIKLSLAVPAVVLERMGPFKALGRSWRLTNGRFWMILGVLVVASLITSVIQNVLAIPVSVLFPLFLFSMDPATAGPLYVGALAIATFAGVLLSIAYLGGVTAGLYTDQRMRQEGFDLTLARAVQGRSAA